MAKIVSSGSPNSTVKIRPALTLEARENQMISLAVDLAEQQLKDGTASSQVITHFLKLGSTKEKIEKEILEEQKKLICAKTEALAAEKRIEAKYDDAIKAMRKYTGQVDVIEDEDYED